MTMKVETRDDYSISRKKWIDLIDNQDDKSLDFPRKNYPQKKLEDKLRVEKFRSEIMDKVDLLMKENYKNFK